MYLVRAFTVWLMIIFAESLHGTLRELFLAPRIGEFPARRIGFFVGISIIFMISYFSVRWINAPSPKALLAAGLMWAISTLAFELGLGVFILNYSTGRLLEDYDPVRGGLMGFGLIFMFFAPFLSVKIRGVKPQIVKSS